MINRSIVRVRVLQQLYNSVVVGQCNLVVAEGELRRSMQDTYYLYYYLLDLPRVLARHQMDLLAIRERRFLKDHLVPVAHRLADMSLVQMIADCAELQGVLQEQDYHWESDDQVVRALYQVVEYSSLYVALPDDVTTMSIQSQSSFWFAIMKQLLQDELLNEHLESISCYWDNPMYRQEKIQIEEMPRIEEVDDVVRRLREDGSEEYQATPLLTSPVSTIKDFVLKTFKRGAKQGLSLPEDLLPMFHNEEDQHFAYRLLHQTLLHREEYSNLLTPLLEHWEQDRLALIDMLIMQMAVTEALHFPDISLAVTLNEYIDLAKTFSTTKSGGFINGVLDRLFSGLRSQGRLLKA